MNWIIKLIGKYTGVSAVWKYIDGAKAYITGTATILTGATGLLQEYLKISQDHNLATIWAFIQTFPANSNWLMILAGFGVIAAASKANKAIAAVNTPVAVPVPTKVDTILCSTVLTDPIDPPAKPLP